jgi:hypothetical protein
MEGEGTGGRGEIGGNAAETLGMAFAGTAMMSPRSATLIQARTAGGRAWLLQHGRAELAG